LERFGCPAVSPFEDGLALLGVAEQRRLEAVVSKRQSGNARSRGWWSAVGATGSLAI